MNKLITNSKTTNFYNYITQSLHECRSFIFNVAFINLSGVQLLLDTFKLLDEKGIRGKILTSTYLNFTEPKALQKILEFKNIQLKVYDSQELNKGFHPKAYLFEHDNEYKIVVGSSNITASAFKTNIEWNIENTVNKNGIFLNSLYQEFESLWEESFTVTDKFLLEYKKYRADIVEYRDYNYKKELKLNFMQEYALERINYIKTINETKALVIAATGTGKTYLAAFEVKYSKPKRLLFLVHRENILLKAKESFEAVIKDKSIGLYTGNKKELDKEYIFSTIQTLSSNYKDFRIDHFDYIIIDEAHHITSPSYKKIYEYFKPGFLLGLTATPNRMDGNNIYKLFDDNIVCDIRLSTALEQNLVAPFHYFGISDIKQIDYVNKDITNTAEIAKLLMVNKRVEYIIRMMEFYSYSGTKRKVLGFCVSKEHAIYMSEEFNKKGIESVCLTSVDSIEKREHEIKRLEDDNELLEVIFSVDIFNEGIDIASVNMILMLRPTNSPIVFVQQLGRGLRKYKGKEFLTVLDFIGNHNKAFLIILALAGNKKIDKESLKLALFNNFAALSNAHIFMDRISKHRILEQIDNENFNSFKYLKEGYLEVKSLLGNKIPALTDFLVYDEYTSPLDYINESKSYIEFLARVEKTKELKDICSNESFLKAVRFIEWLLPVKRVYEFVILKYLLDNDSIDIDTAEKILAKYLKAVNTDTIKHSFEYLTQNYFDKAQISRYLKLAELKGDTLVRSGDFNSILTNDIYKLYIFNSLEYGILNYEKSFGLKDYGMPFFKIYEKYNMLNIAQVCNFNKIHSSFRGSGFLKFKDDFFLFITIEKDKLSTALKYKNDFLSNDMFTFVSKPGHSKDKGDGEKLCKNKEFGVKLHIFARKFALVDKKTQNFIYLGLADSVEHHGDKPVTVKLKLQKTLSDELYEEFTKIV